MSFCLNKLRQRRYLPYEWFKRTNQFIFEQWKYRNWKILQNCMSCNWVNEKMESNSHLKTQNSTNDEIIAWKFNWNSKIDFITLNTIRCRFVCGLFRFYLTKFREKHESEPKVTDNKIQSIGCWNTRPVIILLQQGKLILTPPLKLTWSISGFTLKSK